MPPARVLATFSVLPVIVLLSTSAPACHAAHNVTAILSERSGLAEFSRTLSATGLADGINSQATVTVLAVDDDSMAPLTARGLPREALGRALAFHVLAGYYDDSRLLLLLHGVGGSPGVVASSTLLDAPAGRVKIAREPRDGRVSFAPLHDASASVFYVRPVHEAPYNISVLLVSAVMSSPPAAARPGSRVKPSTSPAPAPPEDGPSSARAHRHLSATWICVIVLGCVNMVLFSMLIWYVCRF